MDIVTYALLNGKIKEYASNVDEWLEENVDPATGYVLDRSLQMENAAAPADMVGDIKDDADDLKNTLNSEIATRQTYVRPNLLDNWYFVYGKAINNDYSSNGTFPVNQRGQQTYSGSSYEIDRWKWWTTNSMSISNDGTGVSLNGFLWQILEESVSNSLLGKTVTISCLFNNGSLISTSGVWATNVLEVSYGDVGILAGAAAAGFAINDPSFIIETQSSQIIQAVKLELGSTQTLAHEEPDGQGGTKWVLNEIPNYAEELAKCQRYYRPFGVNVAQKLSSTMLSVAGPLIPPMANDNISMSRNAGALYAYEDRDITFTVTDASSVSVDRNGVNFCNLQGSWDYEPTAPMLLIRPKIFAWLSADLN